MKLNNYDPIARYYDFLSRLVFGRSEVNAQVEMLKYVVAGSRVLIVGGGTGWILAELAAIHPAGLRITYIEPSACMMALSKKRDCRQNEVSFVSMPVGQWVTEERYDCILTGFVFDNFTVDHCAMVFRLLHDLLREDGYWLFAEFFLEKGQGKWWQALMLKSMYWSARLICRVEARELADTEPLFEVAGYRPLETRFHYYRFIKSIAYQKVGGLSGKWADVYAVGAFKIKNSRLR
jgi:ubiquinone/menaquinone biosynthesis C-methylase UbiE